MVLGLVLALLLFLKMQLVHILRLPLIVTPTKLLLLIEMGETQIKVQLLRGLLVALQLALNHRLYLKVVRHCGLQQYLILTVTQALSLTEMMATLVTVLP